MELIDLPVSAQWLSSSPLYRWSELVSNKSLPPPLPGVYAWFFRDPPGIVPISDCLTREGTFLLYVGISPGRTTSTQNLRKRIRYHFTGNAEGSTLRLTLGCLLERELGTVLMRVGSGRRKTFGPREPDLTQWIAAHARVAWITTEHPEKLETELIGSLHLPLNLDQNASHDFYPILAEARRAARERALLLPPFVPNLQPKSHQKLPS